MDRQVQPSSAIVSVVVFHFMLFLGSLMVPAESDATDSVVWPDFEKLRFDEDYAAVRDAAIGADLPMRLKYLAWGAGDSSRYMSLGGELRERYEYTHNPAFGSEPQDENGVWLQRAVLYSDLHLNTHARIHLQLSSAIADGRAGGPSPLDENRLEWQNAFVDLKRQFTGNSDARVRLGRQELQFGSGRLINVREGTNVRRSFDAVRGDLRTLDWSVAGLHAYPRRSEPGEFDDSRDDALRLSGIYATAHIAWPLPSGLDMYYLRFHDDTPSYVQQVIDEKRHSVGVRLFGGRGEWDWNWEAVYQSGDYAGGTIQAWIFATDTGYRWGDLAWAPRAGLSANVASGDRNSVDDTLHTFNAMLPRGNYFSEDALLGPRNFFNFHPSLEISPRLGWTITTEVNFYWRLEKNDGIYRQGGAVLRAPGKSGERYVGTAMSLNSEWNVGRHWAFTAIYTRFEPGAFIEQTGPNETIDFVEFTMRYKF